MYIYSSIYESSISDPPKVTVFGSSKKSLKHRRNEAIVLPMSPGSPSKLCLTDSQPQYR